jgi:hypothetical protein
MKKSLLAGALTLAALLAGCLGGATDNLDFKVPPGFNSQFSMFGSQMWTKGPKDQSQILMLMKLPVKMESKDFQMPPNSAARDMKIESQQNIMICGNHPAVFIKATGTSSSSNKDVDLEMLMTGWGSTTYFAMYAYPTTTSADPTAEDSLKTVCQKP